MATRRDIQPANPLGPLADRRPAAALRDSAARKEDITLYSRYECKYAISPLVLPALRQFIEPFMRPDPFASLQPGYRYPICSLYLDTEDLHLYQQTARASSARFAALSPQSIRQATKSS